MDHCEKLFKIWRKYAKESIIGTTRLGAPIPLYRTGESPQTLIVAAVHAREYVTADLVTGIFCGSDKSFDVIPVLNIDGVRLSLYGADGLDSKLRSRLLIINGSSDFSNWKANAFGVDINVNFNADWGTGKSNVKYVSSANYIGPYPESEPETRAVTNLIRSGNYAQVVAYHAKGEVVYHGFKNNRLHYDLAKRYADALGYELQYAYGSAGGLKDYFDVVCDGLGLTVEVGEDRFPHPYPMTEIDRLIDKHKGSVDILYENGNEVARRLHGAGIKRGGRSV